MVEKNTYHFESDVDVVEFTNNDDGQRWLIFPTEEEKWGQVVYKAKRVDKEANPYDTRLGVNHAGVEKFVENELIY